MKKRGYLHTFMIPFILFAVLLILTAVLGGFSEKSAPLYVRTNEKAPKERVFDYADKLTDEEEEELRLKIAEAEEKTGVDIVIVILEESLEEYAKSYESIIGPVDISEYVMVYADNFYDENQFGFDEPVGDGILLLDNWFREADGGLYSWVSTSGRVEDHYSEKMLSSLLDSFVSAVETDVAYGYGVFVDLVAQNMDSDAQEEIPVPGWAFLAIGAAAAVIFYLVNHGGRKGKKTTQATTYVRQGEPEIRVREDQFLTKTVTKRKIPKSDGGTSGGGGSHVSAGGHRHGGAGARR